MRWWRVRRRLGARVALFALVVQLALSFGHVHGAHRVWDGFAAAWSGVHADSGASVPGPQDDDHDSRYCAICAVLTLLAGAQTAAAPAIWIPSPRAIELRPVVAATVRLIARHDSFHSRAPPLS